MPKKAAVASPGPAAKTNKKNRAAENKNAKPNATTRTDAKTKTVAPGSQDDAFPIVGIGASAGGFEAVTQLLKNLPPDIGMAFVVVQHLHPAGHSELANLLVRSSALPVEQIRDKTRVEPGHVYVIPPNFDVLLDDRRLRLRKRPSTERVHMPIDHFFQSLAEQERERAIAIVLSGTGS